MTCEGVENAAEQDKKPECDGPRGASPKVTKCQLFQNVKLFHDFKKGSIGDAPKCKDVNKFRITKKARPLTPEMSPSKSPGLKMIHAGPDLDGLIILRRPR